MVVHTSILSHLGFALFFRHFSDLLIYSNGVLKCSYIFYIVPKISNIFALHYLEDLLSLMTLSDSLGSFRVSPRGTYVHHYQLFSKDSGTLHWVHTLISNVKAFLLATYHGLGKKNLQSYFGEFAFRFSRRFWPNQLFPRLVCAVDASNILGYGDFPLAACAQNILKFWDEL